VRAVADDGPRLPSRRGRRMGAVVLCALGCLLCVASLSARWLRGEVLDTNRYLKSVAPLADNPVIQEAIATQVARAVSEQLGHQARDQVPSSVAGLLIGPMDQGVEKVSHQIVLSFVRSDGFRTIWVDMNRTMHQQVVAVLEDRRGSLVAVDGRGVLTLELSPVVAAMAHQLATLGVAEDRLPSLSAQMPVAKLNGIGGARLAAGWLAHAAFWLPLITLATLIGAVLTAVNRRRMLIVVGLSVSATMAVFWLILSVGRSLMVRGLSEPDLRRAATAIVNQVTASLRAEMWTTSAVALAVAGLGIILLASRRRPPSAILAASPPAVPHP
jgi:hypothetical protein